MSKERESGSYWIKIYGENDFFIAKWTDGVSWSVDGFYIPPMAIEEIDERPIVREENKTEKE